MMVLQQACLLSDDIEVRFAALVHDLGKGTTPEDILPRHIDHEERSVDLTLELCRRIKVPNALRDIGVIAARYHTHIHRARELRPSTIMKVLEQTDAFRKPERFDNFLKACEADGRGRLGFEDRPYPQADAFRAWFQAAKDTDLKPAIDQKLKGEEMKNAIRKLRIAQIKKVNPFPSTDDS